MSDIRQEERSWRLYIQDMIDFGESFVIRTDWTKRLSSLKRSSMMPPFAIWN